MVRNEVMLPNNTKLKEQHNVSELAGSLNGSKKCLQTWL